MATMSDSQPTNVGTMSSDADASSQAQYFWRRSHAAHCEMPELASRGDKVRELERSKETWS